MSSNSFRPRLRNVFTSNNELNSVEKDIIYINEFRTNNTTKIGNYYKVLSFEQISSELITKIS